jgi:hypothetical protein
MTDGRQRSTVLLHDVAVVSRPVADQRGPHDVVTVDHRLTSAAAPGGVDPTPRSTARPPPGGTGAGLAHPVRVYLLAGIGYLGLAVVVLWGVWSHHPTSTTTCGCGDTSLFTWFLAWPAYAIAHGSNPLVSTAMFHPTGVNLLSNTGEVGLGVLLTPVTWWFGPIASLNVALTLSPVLSALSMFALLRRWVSWSPAAFIGGVAYGFAPVIIIGLTDGHLMVAMAAIPPLIVACLDEILVRQARRPLVVGALLGLLVTVQFFIGTEILVITAIATGAGLLVVTATALRDHDRLRRHRRHAVTALAAAAAVSVALLAYPLWFALAGPAHLSGPVWGPGAPIGHVGTAAHSFVEPAAAIPFAGTLTQRYGGYQAPVLSGQYLGIGFVAVIVLGLVVWRRDGRLRLFGIVGTLSVLLSLGLDYHHWTPWRLLVRLPLMVNVIPSRFLVVTYLCTAAILGLVIDHARTAARGPEGGDSSTSTALGQGGPPSRGRRWRGAVAGLTVGAVALVPWVTYFDGGLPLTVQPVALPTWFAQVAPTLRGHHVLLTFPVPFAGMQSAMTWQAVDGMTYSMAGGGGPDGLITRAGPEAPGQAILGDLSTAGPSPKARSLSLDQVRAVRQALAGWGVTTVVLPDTTSLPSYVQLFQVRSIVVLITAATGQRPTRQAGAWVWNRVQGSEDRPLPPPARLASCGDGPAMGSVSSISQAAICVMGT